VGRYYALPERALLDDAVLRLECGVDVTAFGVASLTFMMLMYALESRGRRFILAIAGWRRALERLRLRFGRLAVRCRRGRLDDRRAPALPDAIIRVAEGLESRP
jgi:hypothetical protein